MRLNPRYPFWYIFDLVGLPTSRAICEAIVALKEASSRGPNFLGTHNVLASSYLWQGLLNRVQLPRHGAAVAAVQRTLALMTLALGPHSLGLYFSLPTAV